MTRKTLRLKDGFNDTNPHLREEVKQLQKALSIAGYTVGNDGFFGDGTEEAVKKFQKDHGLEADGVVGNATWTKLGVNDESPGIPIPEGVMVGFRGDLGFIHEREGHRGYPYWPGGASGVTLDPGFDLGHVEPETLDLYFKDILSDNELNEMKKALGVKGDSAKKLLADNPAWKNIKVSKSEASKIFPIVSDKYWKNISRRFPILIEKDTPGSVQTALLSLAYNRGEWNKGLDVLIPSLTDKNWLLLANEVASMQQDHKLEGIRKRRRMEADIIRNELT